MVAIDTLTVINININMLPSVSLNLRFSEANILSAYLSLLQFSQLLSALMYGIIIDTEAFSDEID